MVRAHLIPPKCRTRKPLILLGLRVFVCLRVVMKMYRVFRYYPNYYPNWEMLELFFARVGVMRLSKYRYHLSTLIADNALLTKHSTITAKVGKQIPGFLTALILSFYAVLRLHKIRDMPKNILTPPETPLSGYSLACCSSLTLHWRVQIPFRETVCKAFQIVCQNDLFGTI